MESKSSAQLALIHIDTPLQDNTESLRKKRLRAASVEWTEIQIASPVTSQDFQLANMENRTSPALCQPCCVWMTTPSKEDCCALSWNIPLSRNGREVCARCA